MNSHLPRFLVAKEMTHLSRDRNPFLGKPPLEPLTKPLIPMFAERVRRVRLEVESAAGFFIPSADVGSFESGKGKAAPQEFERQLASMSVPHQC